MSFMIIFGNAFDQAEGSGGGAERGGDQTWEQGAESRGPVGEKLAVPMPATPVPASAPAARSLHHSWPQSRLASRSAAM